MSKHDEQHDVQFNIIHLSDLHTGVNGQKWMWPTFKTNFFDDLKNQHEKTGPWDLVVFSGDLTQKSSSEEYENLTSILGELWEIFKSLGSSPKLFVVPGNHDLQRPSKMDSSAIVLSNWWNNPAIHENFWENSKSSYRKTIEDAFAEYTKWMASLADNSIPLVNGENGILPGDISARIHKDGASLGLIGINSAWLHLSDEGAKGSLNIDVRQLLNITGHDPDAWISKNAFNLLVTHHPTTWLHPDAITHWNAEIQANMRFSAHLFGHMHESITGQSTINGGARKISMQAPSIFGLEQISKDLRRTHGYTFLRLKDRVEKKTLTVWPRLSFTRTDGTRRIIADPNWELINDACEFELQVQKNGDAAVPVEHQGSTYIEPEVLLGNNAAANRILRGLRKSTAYSKAAANVRKEDQQYLLAALASERLGWLIDNWGAGGDEFINVVSTRVLGAGVEIYYLAVGAFDGKDSFLAAVGQRLGCSLEQLCRALDQRACVLVLEDVMIEGGNRSLLEHELLFIVRTLLEFSERLHVIIRSRSRPADICPLVQLRPLDEADTTTYVTSHEQAMNLPGESIARIFRHSGGLPARIDAILRATEVVGTQALHDLDADIVGKAAARPDDIPQGLAEAIQELNNSEDEHSRRAARLLNVLSLFPKGEPLDRVRRFYGPTPFHASHATLLLDRGLIDSNPITSMEGVVLSQEQGNALTVRRPVREYLVQCLSAAELRKLNSKALALYFGDNWALRGIHGPADLKFSNAHCSALGIDNASTLILREARAATESLNFGRIKAALTLATSFVGQLRRGDHFRGITQFLDGAIKIFDDYVSTSQAGKNIQASLNLASLQDTHASALRMIGQHERAHQIASAISIDGQSKPIKERALLTLALCKESLKAPTTEIVAAAEACRKINPKGLLALNARYVIVSHQDAPDKVIRLRKLYEEARKRRCHTVANNIALELARMTSDSEQRKRHLKEVIESGKNDNDNYNFVRALLRASQLSLDETGMLTRPQFDDCARAYSYLYAQRIDGLFETCHRILWSAFKARGDQKNLLTLYRYSSLVWRLRERASTEEHYRADLTGILGSRLSKSILAADIELRYFISRSSASVNELPLPKTDTPAN